MAQGIAAPPTCGPVSKCSLEIEVKVPASADRLAWMIRNVERLAPQDGKMLQDLRKRVTDDPQATEQALASLDSGNRRGIPPKLVLEGNTHADCLIECETALIWIEGKRFDWLSPGIKWDISRDQLARNVEAAWSLARAARKEYCVLICHEHPLKHHESALVGGYHNGTWTAGWPHMPEEQRRAFGQRIGTLTWGKIVRKWPALRAVPELRDLESARTDA